MICVLVQAAGQALIWWGGSGRDRFGGRRAYRGPGGLPAYYRENVIGGPGAFLLVVQDFSTFREAITKKLVTEIAATRSLTYACLAPR